MKAKFAFLITFVMLVMNCNQRNATGAQSPVVGSWVCSDFGNVRNGLYGDFFLLQLFTSGQFRLVQKHTGLPDSLFLKTAIDTGIWFGNEKSIHLVFSGEELKSSEFSYDSLGRLFMPNIMNKPMVSSEIFFHSAFRSASDKIKMVAGDAFGYAGTPSEFYMCLEIFDEIVDSAKIASILNSKNDAIRVMGLILALKHHTNITQAKNLENDSTSVPLCEVGCIVDRESISGIYKKACRNKDFLKYRK